MAGNKIKVLVIDDSAVIRRLLTEILNEDSGIEVVGSAQDPLFALNKIRDLRPDVITLDVEMPRMDGLTFLRELMQTDPIPVVMVSSLTRMGCDTTIKALELGAVDYVSKPTLDISSGVMELSDEIIRKVKTASKAKVRRTRSFEAPAEGGPKAAAVAKAGGMCNKSLAPGSLTLDPSRMSTTDKIIAIGASTGGTQAVTEVLAGLSESVPGILIVQHMPPVFTKSFAERLNSISRLDVKEAATGDRVLRGTVLIAPGNKHMAVKRNGAMYYIEVGDGPRVNYVRPSVDVLFRSVAKYAGKNAVGVILTGMGEDGARGMLEMKSAGAFTIAQDEGSSVVFGMPKKAIEIGAVDRVSPLDRISSLILERV